MKPRVFAILVAFNPDPEIASNVEAVIGQIDHLILVDNSTDAKAMAEVNRVAANYPKIDVLRPGGNVGLALAQNMGIKCALQANADWVLLLDDDSLISSDMVNTLLSSLDKNIGKNKVGILAPRVIDRQTNTEGSILTSTGAWNIWRSKSVALKRDLYSALSVIASGSLIRCDLFKDVGLLEEKYFVDSLDVEFCLRARSAGWEIHVVRDALMRHELGRKSQHSVGGRVFLTTNHAAWRRYTMYRNRADIWKRYVRYFPAYIVYDCLVSIYEICKIIAFESAKLKKVLAATRGCIAGLCGHFDNAHLF